MAVQPNKLRLQKLLEGLNRELALNGSTLKGHRCKVSTIAASTSLGLGDSGGLFLLDATDETAAVTITLPELSSDFIGVTYTFAVTDPSDLGFLITTGDVTDTTGDMYIGYAMLGADQVGSTSNGAGGRMLAPSANDSVIHLDGNLANSGGEAGSTVKVTAVSATQWYVEAMILTDDADATGAALFQNGS